LEGVSADMSVFTEEIFGPVLCLHRYDDISEPCMRLNGLDFGLQHAVFTQSLSVFNQVYQDLEVGALLVNESPTWRLDGMPYGGIKRSGNTKEGVRYAYETFTYEKVCVLHLNA
jgi:acyl-CoA reductase-like NAD-dependent aldehyde dehydrogenase